MSTFPPSSARWGLAGLLWGFIIKKGVNGTSLPPDHQYRWKQLCVVSTRHWGLHGSVVGLSLRAQGD